SIAGARVPEPPQGAATLVPEPPGARPAGWFGFALACSGCGWAREAGDENARWESREPPVIRSVEPGGPADVAGLRRGDRIAAIDGLSITSREGGSRLGSARPGERVVLEVERDGSTVRADVTIATRPTPRAPGAPEPTAAPGTGASPTPPPAGQPAPAPVAPPEPVLRYEGRLGDVRIEVSGQPVVVLESGDELELLIGGTRVRLRLDPSDR
ncbi:MAG: PDZ domain-containing protein, partial [Gemmatimonadota bacterium]|nr:PDZ domain-containing protein [Gemmatimonadota bacterium]